jgi:hypothetical protein
MHLPGKPLPWVLLIPQKSLPDTLRPWKARMVLQKKNSYNPYTISLGSPQNRLTWCMVEHSVSVLTQWDDQHGPGLPWWIVSNKHPYVVCFLLLLGGIWVGDGATVEIRVIGAER